MKISEIVCECRRIAKSLPHEYAPAETMRCLWGTHFDAKEAIERAYELDDASDPDLMARFIAGMRAPQTPPTETERLLIFLRLLAAIRNLPRVVERDEPALPFRTLESSLLWATNRFWSVARYETVPRCVRWYERLIFPSTRED